MKTVQGEPWTKSTRDLEPADRGVMKFARARALTCHARAASHILAFYILFAPRRGTISPGNSNSLYLLVPGFGIDLNVVWNVVRWLNPSWLAWGDNVID
ncbi:hypothetical protein BPOR_0675g00070 [Botrytis porri]|uniref:Uncharacterized protein n=1 Tax=Botrytis porri TaxID=87229 RepID=A0A4Z1KD31_9HELO|nr:hypothetical protein BPOR_0675g00070 [Botrytis porri]